jgi:pimeloyl-[acyl-carrier protein] synthase
MSWKVKVDTATFALEFVLNAGLDRLTRGRNFNPMRKELRSDPHPYYRTMRERDPVHRSRVVDGLVLTRYDDCYAVLADQSFSSDERNMRRFERFARRNRNAGLPDPDDARFASMLRMDAPDHTRLRGLVSKAFTPRAIDSWRGRLEEVVHELFDRLPPHGDIELVRAFAQPLPVIVIAEVLGVPSEDREKFRHWSNEAVRMLGDGSIDDARRGMIAFEELGAYLWAIAESRRDAPRDDLISGLVAAEEAGDRLSRDELVATCVLLLVAGNETTAKLVGNSVVALLRNPQQRELLVEEPKRIEPAIEELLRYDGPVQFTSRMVTEDRVVCGEPVEAGQQIILGLTAANRDPARFEDPDRLDVLREDVRHLAFSHGTHFCLGARLARLETMAALEAILTRMPDLRFGDDPITWSDNTILRGPVALPLRY